MKILKSERKEPADEMSAPPAEREASGSPLEGGKITGATM